MNAPCALVLHDVHHRYGPTEVLHGIGIQLAAGEELALVGPSGCGKTTLLHLAAGLLVCQQGRVDNSFAHTAVMFQQPRLLPWQRTVDNIALGLRAAGFKAARARLDAAEMGRAMGLDDDALGAYPMQLSGGMQSRAALARALVLQPDLLLLDEPFSALDIGLKAQLHALLRSHVRRRGTAVLMITHDLTEAAALADRVLVMAAGPGRIVHAWRPAADAAPADEAQAHQAVAWLLREGAVRAAFDLPPLPGAAAQPPANVHRLPGVRRG